MNEIENDVKRTSVHEQITSSSWLSWFGYKKETPSSPTARVSPPRIGVLFGSHNWDSQKLILSQLVKRGLASVDGALENGDPIVRVPDEIIKRLSVAQLYGLFYLFLHLRITHSNSTGRYDRRVDELHC